MTEYRYIGIADEVSLSEEDFTRHDVTDQGAVTFNKDNNFTSELTDAAAEMLTAQGFKMMKSSDYQSFLEQKRTELAAEEKAAREAQAEAVPPTPSADELRAEASPAIPARPGSDAGRDELADYAWTHYQIPVDTAEHNMTKAEINKALDQAEKTGA